MKIKDFVRELIYRIAPSVVKNAINEAARPNLLEKRIEKMQRRAARNGAR